MPSTRPSQFRVRWSMTVRSGCASPVAITRSLEAGGYRRVPAPVLGTAPDWQVRAPVAGQLNAFELAACEAIDAGGLQIAWSPAHLIACGLIGEPVAPVITNG